jgi:hypothetical protein
MAKGETGGFFVVKKKHVMAFMAFMALGKSKQ